MKPTEIAALVIIAIGFAMVIAAKSLVRRYDLADKQSCEYSDEMSEEEVESYKFNKASLRIKMMGLIITIPGLILLILGR